MRNSKGQFVKGYSSSIGTQFKKGDHWRDHKPFWDKEWLENEYVNNFRSTIDIANEFNITEGAILFWLKKHKIPRRSVTEIRRRKHWGLVGKSNPMFGKTGSKHQNWKGGITSERQSFYSSLEWKNCIKHTWVRANHKCERCNDNIGKGIKLFAIHHIVSFSVSELRFDLKNLVLLCKNCHSFVHSKKNITNEYLLTHEQFIAKYGSEPMDQ